jgi:uncharacterized membrane protein
MRSRVLFAVGGFLAASAWCVLLVAARRHELGPGGFRYLVWNLLLAWVPFVLSVLMLELYKRRQPALELIAVGLVWLVFLPNAPYLVTDFVHLGSRHRLFDSIIFGSFAFTGMALGFASLLLVQLIATRAAGALAGWALALSALFLSSIGVYLGRVQRLNSWDVLQRPHYLADVARARLEDPFGNRYLIGFVLVVGGFLMLTYLGLYAFSWLAAGLRADDR